YEEETDHHEARRQQGHSPEAMQRHGASTGRVLADQLTRHALSFSVATSVFFPHHAASSRTNLPCCCGPPDSMLARSAGMALNAAGTTGPYVYASAIAVWPSTLSA